MAASPSSTKTGFHSNVTEYLDAEPLTLSSHGDDLDVFDFFLNDDDDNMDTEMKLELDLDLVRSTAGMVSGIDDDVDVDEMGSVGFEEAETETNTLESSLNNMHFDIIQEGEAEAEDNVNVHAQHMPNHHSNCHYQPSRRNHQQQQQGQVQVHNQQEQHQQRYEQRFQVNHNAVDFDPPMQQQQYQRQTSVSDFSMCSYATAQSQSSSHQTQTPYPSQHHHHHRQDHQHRLSSKTLQLQKLAESMKRTEETRRHILQHRNSMPVAQQMALRMAKEQLARENLQVHDSNHQQQQHLQRQHDQQQQQERLLSTGQSSVMAAFFSGSRTTLTNGLEHSRRQLGLYIMNNTL